jgi:L-methionine (R)-S-oxide reductase
MAEDLIISKHLSKEEKYQMLLPQLAALFAGEDDLIANLANGCAALKTTFDFWWVGFYLVKNDELVLGPFQGPVACTRIKKGRGVCGTSWQKAETIIVPNVDEFPGHIACSSASKSEIVLPIFNKYREVIMVLDVDSEFLNHFDEVDAKYLTQFTQLIQSFA